MTARPAGAAAMNAVSAPPPSQTPNLGAATNGAWQRHLAAAVRDPDTLIALLELPEEYRAPARRAAGRFQLVVPRGFIARMERGNPRDPLLLQVLPLAEEEIEDPAFVADPVGDLAAQHVPGLLEKYEGRALLIAAGVCAVNCRYCFRREFPYDAAPRGLASWRPALARIAEDPSIREAILSGGDPLALTDHALARLVGALAEIPHLKRLRIHSRLPVVIPERVTAELLAMLTATRLVPYLVIHANHPAEIDDACAAALLRLAAAGVTLMNQSVLLRGVNDDAGVLAALCERLLDARVLPYYLHQLDPVRGGSHFHVPIERGRAIVAALAARLPGYAVPRYVAEIPGAPYKEPLR
ncbi:MAG: EF-P beta-lysylation protein EpmB [Planctomycetes bacterium]|nr:EF-P beta-lysylation protein EpmB [Planctomycetota bacterium]